MDIDFSNVSELKERLIPALRFRRRELKKSNILISEEDIWSYLVINFWKNYKNLSLAQMVDDILKKQINIKKEEIL